MTVLCLLVAGLVACMMSSTARRDHFERTVTRLLKWSKCHLHRPGGDPATLVSGFVERFGYVQLSFPTLTLAFLGSMVNWLADVLCLALAIQATTGRILQRMWVHRRERTTLGHGG